MLASMFFLKKNGQENFIVKLICHNQNPSTAIYMDILILNT